MWVTAWEAGLLTPAQADETIRLAKQANLNTLMVQVRKTGDAYYDSAYEPRGENLHDPSYDPLAYVVGKAHDAGLEVHVWVNTLKVWQGEARPRSRQHIFNRHPEWLNRNIEGKLNKEGQFALDPGIPEVRDYTFGVVTDIVRKYDVDGVHFDYVRYWDRSFGYSALAVAAFNKETGRTGVPQPADPRWCQWRRDQVTELVRRVYRAVKETKPNVKVSAAVICSRECPPNFEESTPYNYILQDWVGWLREGIVDAVLPMNYRDENKPGDANEFRRWTDAMVRWKNGRHVYNGLYIRSTRDLVTQISESRKRGTDGFCGFAFNGSFDRQGIASALRQQVSQTAVPVPPMPWKSATASEQPSDPKELFNLAVRAASKGDLDAAIQLMKQAAEADPSSAEAHYRLGSYYLRKGLKTEAVSEFREALKLNSAHGGAHVGLKRAEAVQ